MHGFNPSTWVRKMTPLLEVTDIKARYGAQTAVAGVSLSLAEGETLALAGANGAGKTTLMRVLTGLMMPAGGSIRIDGHTVPPGQPRAASGAGVALVPEGRLLFDSLSVAENLMIGAGHRPGPWSLKAIYDLFPVLEEKGGLPPSALSGGQQQMVAIGRALAANPRVLLCDEISLGLSPRVTAEVYVALKAIRSQGVAMILVDQDVARAQTIADRIACMFQGRLTLTGAAGQTAPDALRAAFFGEPA